MFLKAEDYLRHLNEVTDVYSTIGNYENNNVVNAGTIYVILKDAKHRDLTQGQMMIKVRDDLRRVLPTGSEVFTQDLSLTGFSASRGYPVEFVLEGPDWTKLQSLSKTFIDKFKATGLVDDLNTDFEEGMPELLVHPDRVLAANRGVSVSNIGSEVANLIGGDLFSANTEYPKDGTPLIIFDCAPIPIRRQNLRILKPFDFATTALAPNLFLSTQPPPSRPATARN